MLLIKAFAGDPGTVHTSIIRDVIRDLFSRILLRALLLSDLVC